MAVGCDSEWDGNWHSARQGEPIHGGAGWVLSSTLRERPQVGVMGMWFEGGWLWAGEGGARVRPRGGVRARVVAKGSRSVGVGGPHRSEPAAPLIRTAQAVVLTL